MKIKIDYGLKCINIIKWKKGLLDLTHHRAISKS